MKNHKEALKERSKLYYEDNKGAIKKKNKIYEEQNKEAIAEREIKYVENIRIPPDFLSVPTICTICLL